jgi:hypothetical protein
MKTNCLIIIFLTCCFFCGSAQKKDLKWRFNLSGGIGHLYTNTSLEEKRLIEARINEQKIKDLYDDLKGGIQGSADIHYLVNRNFGAGIKYIFFTTDGELEEAFKMSPLTGYTDLILSFKSRDCMNYAGPSIHARTFLNNNLVLSFTLSGGYTHYKSLLKRHENYFFTFWYNKELRMINITSFSATGKTFGMYAGAGSEYFLNKQISIGLDAGWFYSTFSKMTIETRNGTIKISEEVNLKELNGKKENISRFDFSLGVKFYL